MPAVRVGWSARAACAVLCALGAAALGPSARAAPPRVPAVLAAPTGPVVVWGGDVLLGRGAGAAPDVGPLAGVRPLLAGADRAVVNLEGALTRRPRRAPGPFDLAAPPERAAWLAAAGVDAAGLANNHAGDHGPAGLADTAGALRAVGIASFGAAGRAVWREAVGGVRLAVVGCDATRLGAPGAAADCAAAESAVRAERARADVVAVLAHWGEEYAAAPGAAERALARRWVAAGADLIVGSHAHVAWPVRWEASGGRIGLVAYGLGNLAFDSPVPAARRGLVLETALGAKGVAAYRTRPIVVLAGATRPVGAGAAGAWIPPPPPSNAATGDETGSRPVLDRRPAVCEQ